MNLSGLDLIESYNANPGYYLPMKYPTKEIPSRNEYGEVNIGWYAGLIEENRPFFVECWAIDQMTNLTISVSAKEIEDKTAEEIDQWFQKVGYYSYRSGKRYPAHVDKMKKTDGNEFFIINLCVGIDDEPALIDGAPIIPWNVLNEYDKKISE